jgi:predicted nucleic acid-binding protein
VAKRLVVDSSVILASVVPETCSSKAQQLLSDWQNQNIQLAAPILLRYEIVAAVRKFVYRQRISNLEGVRLRDELLQKHIEYFLDESLFKRAYDIATQLNRPTAYDAQYLALAERLDCEFWTADEKLFNAAAPHIPQVRWLGTITP